VALSFRGEIGPDILAQAAREEATA